MNTITSGRKFKTQNQIAFAAILLLLAYRPTVSQAELALDFTGLSENGFRADLSLGWSFTVTDPVVVHSLGLFDSYATSGEGLFHDHLVRLWTDDFEDPQELASTVITNASTPVASSAEDGQWLFNEISPLVLTPGEYVIGADDPPCVLDCDGYRFITSATAMPQIEFGDNRVKSGLGFPRSANDGRNDGYFGPNFMARGLPGPDLNSNDLVDCNDVDALVAEIVLGSNSANFDMTGDGVVDIADLDEWRRQAGAINLPSGGTYPIADANLNGTTDVSDFNVWNANKFTDATGWCSGDFNADGVVDVSDFNLWNVHKFTSADSVATVPEPSGYYPALWMFGLILARRVVGHRD
ncbi:MAG: hypothetical protein AAF497_17080 [Planctomycetota bacterium]